MYACKVFEVKKTAGNIRHCMDGLLTEVGCDPDDITVTTDKGAHIVAATSQKQEAPLMLRGQRGSCKNIKGEPQIFGSFKATPTFPLGVVLWWVLANPSCVPNLKSLASAIV